MRARGWTTRELAHAARISYRTLMRILNGHQDVKLARMNAIAAALGHRSSDLLRQAESAGTAAISGSGPAQSVEEASSQRGPGACRQVTFDH